MTMTNARPAGGFETVVPGSRLGWGGIGRMARTVMVAVTQAVETSRMIRVLQGLSDWQLADIGLARSDIGDFARWLVAGKGENRWHGAAGNAVAYGRQTRLG